MAGVRAWTTFVWQADYGQFYLIDGDGADFTPPIEFTPEMEQRRLSVPAAGLVVYTNDSLQQHIRIAIYDAQPDHAAVEWQSGKAWTQIEQVEVNFPSRRFSISSPSHPDPLPAGPVFLPEVAALAGRVAWMEFDGPRDDSQPVEPDVIEITLWPR